MTMAIKGFPSVITIRGRLEPYEGALELNKWFVSEVTSDDKFPGLDIAWTSISTKVSRSMRQ